MSVESIDIISMVANAGLMVQLVLALLFIFSVASWAIIVIKYRYLRRAYKESVVFIDYFWKTRIFSAAFAKSKRLDCSPLARVFRIGYAELKNLGPPSGHAEGGFSGAGLDNVKRALRRAINTEVTIMTQMVPFLATTGNTTPFIGLFGTVWGIMNSFHGIGQRGSASLAVVAPGISEALIATAAGLAVAIPAVIAFNYFMHRIRILETELQSFSSDFLNIVERDWKRTKGDG